MDKLTIKSGLGIIIVLYTYIIHNHELKNSLENLVPSLVSFMSIKQFLQTKRIKMQI